MIPGQAQCEMQVYAGVHTGDPHNKDPAHGLSSPAFIPSTPPPPTLHLKLPWKLQLLQVKAFARAAMAEMTDNAVRDNRSLRWRSLITRNFAR